MNINTFYTALLKLGRNGDDLVETGTTLNC